MEKPGSVKMQQILDELYAALPITKHSRMHNRSVRAFDFWLSDGSTFSLWWTNQKGVAHIHWITTSNRGVGYGKDIVGVFKKLFHTIVAKTVLEEATGFWEKQGFRPVNKNIWGNWSWKF